MARTINTVLNKCSESRHPCLAAVLRGNAFSFSSLRMMLALILSYMLCMLLIYLFLVLLHKHAGSLFPDQGSSLSPMQWNSGFSTTGLPGKFMSFIVLNVCCLCINLVLIRNQILLNFPNAFTRDMKISI